MKIRKLLLAVCPLIIVVGFLSGCHTVKGAGEDITQTGETVTNTAQAATT